MMTQEDSKVFVDTNILIYIKLKDSPFHQQSVQKLNEILEKNCELWISRQVIREYFSCVTKEEALLQHINSSFIQKEYEELKENFLIANDTEEVSDNLIDFYSKFIITGKQIHDANIAATMKTFGIPYLFTKNSSDFKRFKDFIEVISV